MEQQQPRQKEQQQRQQQQLQQLQRQPLSTRGKITAPPTSGSTTPSTPNSPLLSTAPSRRPSSTFTSVADQPPQAQESPHPSPFPRFRQPCRLIVPKPKAAAPKTKNPSPPTRETTTEALTAFGTSQTADGTPTTSTPPTDLRTKAAPAAIHHWNENPAFVYSPSSFLDTLDGDDNADSFLDSPPPTIPSSPTITNSYPPSSSI